MKVHVSEVAKIANIISSHTLYKVKSNDNGKLYIKTRIVSHGNHDKTKLALKSDVSSCLPVGLRYVCSFAIIFLRETLSGSQRNNTGDREVDRRSSLHRL